MNARDHDERCDCPVRDGVMAFHDDRCASRDPRAERDKLRVLLREASTALSSQFDHEHPLAIRIDAALGDKL